MQNLLYRAGSRINRTVRRIFISGAMMLGIVGTIEVESDPKLAVLIPLLIASTYAFTTGCDEYLKIRKRNLKKRLTKFKVSDIV